MCNKLHTLTIVYYCYQLSAHAAAQRMSSLPHVRVIIWCYFSHVLFTTCMCQHMVLLFACPLYLMYVSAYGACLLYLMYEIHASLACLHCEMFMRSFPSSTSDRGVASLLCAVTDWMMGVEVSSSPLLPSWTAAFTSLILLWGSTLPLHF